MLRRSPEEISLAPCSPRAAKSYFRAEGFKAFLKSFKESDVMISDFVLVSSSGVCSPGPWVYGISWAWGLRGLGRAVLAESEGSKAHPKNHRTLSQSPTVNIPEIPPTQSVSLSGRTLRATWQRLQDLKGPGSSHSLGGPWSPARTWPYC